MKRSDDHNSMPRPDFGPQLGDAIYLRCPTALLPAVKRVAGQRATTASAYMRQAIVDRLKRDGFNLLSNGEAM
jgi:hypothetical protein